MKRLALLFLACCASIAGYCLLFGFVVSRPLVIDEIGEMLRLKLSYANAAASPKIFIVAGSNARFSHSCAVIEQRLHRPCINLGISGEVALDWLLESSRPFMQQGDIVYLPLELGQYSNARVSMMTGADAAYRWRHDKASLLSRGPEGVARAAFMFDLRTLADSVVEMALAASGFRRRVGTATLNIQGDEIGHTDEHAAEFESFLAAQIYVAPDPARVLNNPDGAQATLTTFLDWCRRNGVVAVGGLPTHFDDESHGDALIVTLRDFYARSGAAFIALANRSQYPRRYFFDTPAHLRQSAQVAHSELVADALRPFVR